MFPRAKRLSRAGFSARGRRFASEHFSIALHDATGHAVVVAKSVAKSSVVRHKLKRRLSALLEHRELPDGIVLYARTGAPTLSLEALKRELIELLEQVR